MAIQDRPIVGDPRWSEHPGEEYIDAIVTAMALGGIDHLFFTSGSEIAFFQEAIARADARGWPAPRLITVTHEGATLHAALGSTMVSGRPTATAGHVDVGTINYGGAVHNAWRGPYPVLITAGTGPRGYPGSMIGARDASVQWVQEPRDQGEILRQYTKMDHRLEHQDNPGLMVSRLLQVAMTEPKGPVYMALPRETAMLPLPGRSAFPTVPEMGVPGPSWPDPDDAKRVARWFIDADNPGIYPGKSGRNPGSVAQLVRLAELLAIPVMSAGRPDRLNFPTTHPLSDTGPEPHEADVLLVLENPIPFIPPRRSPRAGAKIAWADVDGVQSRYKTMEFSADVWMTADSGAVAQAIADAAEGMLTQSDLSRIAARRARLEERKQALAAEAEREAVAAGKRSQLHPRWVAYQLCRLMDERAILLDDAVSNGAYLDPYHRRSQPSTFFSSGGSGGGWGMGAAFGAKLAAPDRDVVLASGDGFFMFGEPLAALWSAAHYQAPFLTLVFNNRAYSTGTTGLRRLYPEGVAVEAGNYAGGTFDPPPDFAKLAEAAGGYGELVREADQVEPALRRALEQTRKGTPAVVAAWLPTPIEEQDFRS